MKLRADMHRIRRVRAAQVASVGHAFCQRNRTSCDDAHGRNTTIARISKCELALALYVGPKIVGPITSCTMCDWFRCHKREQQMYRRMDGQKIPSSAPRVRRLWVRQRVWDLCLSVLR